MDSSEPCAKCLSFLAPRQPASTKADSPSCCPICLGLWDEGALKVRLLDAIRRAAEPYGGCLHNRFSGQVENRQVSVPGDVIFRYHAASRGSKYQSTAARLHSFAARIKQYANELLAACLETYHQESKLEDDKYPDFVTGEEQGFLALNVILVTPNALPRPGNMMNIKQNLNKKGRRKQYTTQGGHPRSSLERKLELDGRVAPLWTINQAVDLCEKQSIDDWFMEKQPLAQEEALQIHVALWRRPFLVQGCYTKTRRDVSQTPFFINDDDNNSKKRRRLGATSVEELILPTVVDLCGGISTTNNSPDNNNVLYGMAKFHASGREDMDVRMILPFHQTNSDKNITGRPFCLEVMDALRMPTVQDLKQMSHTINHNTGGAEESTLLPESNQYYGRSPMGVGVGPTALLFAKGEFFRNLQSESEEKHKFYGCLCWSETKLPPLADLTQLLTTDVDTGKSLFPLELKQRTPIRVLHRRANAIRVRHILSCHHMERFDDHYFRIHISTDAGTYVKEFCHGDLGRTQPNVTTLLGGKVDILELDCEGVVV